MPGSPDTAQAHGTARADVLVDWMLAVDADTYPEAADEYERRAAILRAAADNAALPNPDPAAQIQLATPLPYLLRAAAYGRREYAQNAPADSRDVLLHEAHLLEQAARIADGDIGPLYWLLPSWRWSDEMLTALGTRDRPDTTGDVK